MRRGGFAYIMTNKYHTTFYVGVTAYLKPRVYDHKTKRNPKCFTARYNLDKLVYYEGFHWITEAIYREDELKGKSRAKKIDLINKMNSGWRDLYDDLEDA
jgi:putative endonuclease